MVGGEDNKERGDRRRCESSEKCADWPRIYRGGDWTLRRWVWTVERGGGGLAFSMGYESNFVRKKCTVIQKFILFFCILFSLAFPPRAL